MHVGVEGDPKAVLRYEQKEESDYYDSDDFEESGSEFDPSGSEAGSRPSSAQAGGRARLLSGRKPRPKKGPKKGALGEEAAAGTQNGRLPALNLRGTPPQKDEFDEMDESRAHQ
eukprot:4117037-Pyramimonas_sp.AAC.1